MGNFNVIILCLSLNLTSILGHPEDITCFEENFSSTLQHSDHHYGTSPQNYQKIIITQLFNHMELQGSHVIKNETIVKTETVKLVEGEKTNLAFKSQVEEPSTNPRNLTLFYFVAKGELTKAAIGHYHHETNSSGTYQNWTCSTVLAKAPKKASLVFSTVSDQKDNSKVTVDVETLELEIIQSDVSCFEKNFPEIGKDNLEQDKCRDRNTQIVDIQHIVRTETHEAIFKEMREILVKGEKKFVELTSQTTDVLNPRFLVMLFDGVSTKTSINDIFQELPTKSTCLSVYDSAPNAWSPIFATTVYPKFQHDRLRVDFRDPKKPWGDKKDLECFGIQFPDCGPDNDSKGGPKNASIYVSHYYQQLFETTTVKVETILVNVTEGVDKIVEFEYRYQSDSFEDENPRNLSLSLVGSELHVGIGQLFDDFIYGSDWTCLNSSIVLPLGSEEKKEIMFYKAEYMKDSKYVIHKEFLSFSWNIGVRIHGTGIYLSIIALYVSIITLQ